MSSLKKDHTVHPAKIDNEIADFLVERESRNLTTKTLLWYSHSLSVWRTYAVSQSILTTTDVTPSHIRKFLIHLSKQGYNDGGVFNVFSALRAYIKWYAEEFKPADWENPLDKIKAPKRSTQPLLPLSLDDFNKMVATCKAKTFAGERDKAMFLFLLDSGVRKAELTDLNYGDIDIKTGQVLIRQGKGRKPRVVFVGAKTRRALSVYIRHLIDTSDEAPMWVTRGDYGGERLTQAGIRQIVRRRANRAGVEEPGLHEFRRAFAINSYRNGMSVAEIQRLLGHTSITVTMKYLALEADDLKEAHRKNGPVDRMK